MSQEFLRQLPLFADLPEEDLTRLVQMAEQVSVGSGQVLMEEGAPGNSLYVLLEGMLEVSKRSGQQEVVIDSCQPGKVLGELSLLEQMPRSATVRALTESHLVKINQDSFEELLARSPSAALAILKTVTTHLRNTESMLRQNEKMAALGTLAAGLAHELNNPAAAVRRSAGQLREALDGWQRHTTRLETMAFNARQNAAIKALREETDSPSPAGVNSLARLDRESELEAWLEAHEVEEAWELAPTLLTLGWDVERLEKLAEDFSSPQLAVVVPWVAARGSLYQLLDEVSQGAERISETVRAVKTYSYLDQAPIQDVDIHEGLEDTLVILRHKLGEDVRVTRDYAPNLPRIEAYARELNQVWTNILDNALDAIGGKGELLLRTYASNGQVVVEIHDDGPGIPPEIQARIFEPFYTTKAPGVGAGLGLHIAYKVTVERHQGQIRVISQPGATCFQVTLPTRLRRTS